MSNFYLISLVTLVSVLFTNCKQSSNELVKIESVQKTKTDTTDTNTIKIAFGSCNDENKSQNYWKDIQQESADLWIWLGDNIYADTDNMSEMKAQYDKQNSHSEYIVFKNSTPINGTWDDHDYGENDAGREFRQKDASAKLFLDFIDIPDSDTRRNRKGIYGQSSLRKGDLSVNIFYLDTRYFRDKLKGKGGKYKAENKGTVLGKDQWTWLSEAMLKSKADINIIVSSIQVIPEQHGWEKWNNFPSERSKLFDLIISSGISNPIFISGDRHLAEISTIKYRDVTLYDITSSSLNRPINDNNRVEENKWRVENTHLFTGSNYGILKISEKENKLDIMAEIKSSFGENEIVVSIE